MAAGKFSGKTRIEGVDTPGVQVDALDRVTGTIVASVVSSASGDFEVIVPNPLHAHDLIARPTGKNAVISDSRMPIPLYDPDEALRSLILHFDGDSDGATTLIDSSIRPKSVTCSGGASVSSASPLIGTRSLLVPTGGVCNVEHHADLDFTSGDWCIEFVYSMAANPTQSQILATKANGTNGPYAFQIYMGVDRKITARSYYSNGTVVWTISGVTVLPINTPISVAVSRDGDTFRLFLNGNLEGTANFSGNLQDSGTPMQIGGYSTRNYTANGKFDEIRVTKGIPVRVAPYTPSHPFV